jgi:uncharacterized membrane protein YraQ (UPF0718 family)
METKSSDYRHVSFDTTDSLDDFSEKDARTTSKKTTVHHILTMLWSIFRFIFIGIFISSWIWSTALNLKSTKQLARAR